MLGFLTCIVVEAATGRGIIGQVRVPMCPIVSCSSRSQRTALLLMCKTHVPLPMLVCTFV